MLVVAVEERFRALAESIVEYSVNITEAILIVVLGLVLAYVAHVATRFLVY